MTFTAWTGEATPGRYELARFNWRTIENLDASFGVDIASMIDDFTTWTEEVYI